MKTVTIEVGDMLSTLSALGVEKQLVKLLGVHRAHVNHVGGSATVAVSALLHKRTRLEGIRALRSGSAKTSGAGNHG